MEGVLPDVAERLNHLPPEEVLAAAVQSSGSPLLEIVSCWEAGLLPVTPVKFSEEAPSTKLSDAATVKETLTV